MNEEIQPSVAQTEEESADLNTTEEIVDSETTEEPEVDWKSEAEKAKELANNQRIRAEKAEKRIKESHVETKVETKDISSMDTIAFINAKVTDEEDVREVLDYAKFKKISVSEALKSPIVKASLQQKEELRNTANATSTGRNRPGSAKVSGDTLLEKARKTGEVPDTEEGLNALLDSRYSKKK